MGMLNNCPHTKPLLSNETRYVFELFWLWELLRGIGDNGSKYKRKEKKINHKFFSALLSLFSCPLWTFKSKILCQLELRTQTRTRAWLRTGWGEQTVGSNPSLCSGEVQCNKPPNSISQRNLESIQAVPWCLQVSAQREPFHLQEVEVKAWYYKPFNFLGGFLRDELA